MFHFNYCRSIAAAEAAAASAIPKARKEAGSRSIGEKKQDPLFVVSNRMFLFLPGLVSIKMCQSKWYGNVEGEKAELAASCFTMMLMASNASIPWFCRNQVNRTNTDATQRDKTITNGSYRTCTQCLHRM